ncbi:MAG TPA: GNAT family N-acetyltransferase [Telluria sp.]|jgi:predicted GNAT family N-acyltransferase
MAIRVVPLETVHEVSEFNCGNNDLNVFLQTIARQHQRKFISKTYVLIDDDAPTVVMGFYTVAVRKMVAKDDLPPEMAKKIPTEVPGFSLARLAIQNELQGCGHGEYMLFHALARAARVADEIGGYAVFVDAKDEAAATFYKKYGFIPFPDDPLTLCLKSADIPRL